VEPIRTYCLWNRVDPAWDYYGKVAGAAAPVCVTDSGSLLISSSSRSWERGRETCSINFLLAQGLMDLEENNFPQQLLTEMIFVPAAQDGAVSSMLNILSLVRHGEKG